MDYMTSVSSNNGVYNLSVIFEPGSDTDIDQVLTNMRYGQASLGRPPPSFRRKFRARA